jgi:enoyl-CoA hydratase/carnithine racemase
MPTPGEVRVTTEDGVALLTLDRPPVNALSLAFAAELQNRLASLAADEGVRVVVLTGAGDKAFCAGGDIEEMASLDPPRLVHAIRFGQRFLWDLEHYEKVTIAAVNGPCLGAGNGLAMACDLRVASDRAVFGHPEVALGLTAAYAGSLRLARLVGLAKAKELVYTGRRIDAATAKAIGLVNRVVPHETLLDEALDLAKTVAAHSPLALRLTKKAFLEGSEKLYTNAFVVEARYFSQAAEGEDLWEGLAAYREKRPPRWKGA